MTSTTLTETEPMAAKSIAPWWHTVVLVGLFLGLTVAGAVFQHAMRSQDLTPARSGHLPLYLSTVFFEWGLLFYVWRGGLRRSGTTLRTLIGGRWGGWPDVLRDTVFAVVLWGVWKATASGLDRILGADSAASIQGFLPRGPAEISAWILVSLTAGICEEVIFRGYFLKQFTALTRSRWGGLVLQALLFGIAHGYQGVIACAKIAVYGVLFGMLVLWRRSLRPGMITHAGTDVVSGIFGI